jgi:hypothetical protein
MSHPTRPSIPVLLSVAIAFAGVGGAIGVAAATGGGTAPSNGEMVFDQPGCGRYEYDGPGHRPRIPPSRPCPAPTPVILVQKKTDHSGATLFVLDGSRSYDRVGGRIIAYRWSIGPRQLSTTQPRITLAPPSQRAETVTLSVTDDSGSGAATSVLLRSG